MNTPPIVIVSVTQDDIDHGVRTHQAELTRADFRCAYCGIKLYWRAGIADEPWPHFDRFECQDAYCRKHNVRYGEWGMVS